MPSDPAFVLIALSVAVVLIAFELLAIDLVALILIIAVVAGGVLTPQQAFFGFASEVVISLAAVFVIAGTVARAGLAEMLARIAFRRAGRDKRTALVLVMSVSAALSTLFSNTSTTSVLTPAALSYARRARIGASGLLMPLGFASMMGGTMTLIGTSTNLSASGMITGLGLEPFRFFEFFAIGGIVAVSGIAYMALFGSRLIPDRRPLDLAEDYGVRRYLSELVFPEQSRAVGKQIGELGLDELELVPLSVLRGDARLSAHRLRKIEAGDRMMVKGTLDGLLRARDDKRFVIEAESGAKGDEVPEAIAGIGEAVVMPQSRLVGRRLGGSLFFRRYRLVVLAVHRRGRAFVTSLDEITLEAGDVLLVQGASDDLAALKGNPDLWGLVEVGPPRPTVREGYIALALLGLAVALASSGVIPLSIALLSVVVVLAITSITPAQEAYRMIDWRLLVMIGGMTGFGLAMHVSGAAQLVAGTIMGVISPFGITASITALAVLTVILTQPMSNAAAALTMVPIGLSSAELLGIDPRSVAVLITLSASLSFIAPFEPALLIVYGPGRYRFSDFIRGGGPLTLLTVALLVLLVPVFWPL